MRAGTQENSILGAEVEGGGNNVRGPSFPRISEDISCWKKKKSLHPNIEIFEQKEEGVCHMWHSVRWQPVE